MEKKLSKKEREELERSLRSKRREFIEAVEGFWRDVENAEDYLKTKGEKVSEEERERLFRRYSALNEYKLNYDDDSKDGRMWSIIRFIVHGTKRNYGRGEVDKYLTIKLEEDDLYLNDIIWNIDELRLLFKEAKKYGFKRIFYMNNSSGAMETIGQALELGMVIDGNTYDVEFDRFGLIFNIENVNLEEEELEDEAVREDIRKNYEVLGDQVKYDMYNRDIRRKMVLKYSKTFGLEKVYNTCNNIKNELVEKATQPKEEE